MILFLIFCSICSHLYEIWQLLSCFIGDQAKIPDIEKCLDVVATLQAKKGTGEVRYCNVMNYLYLSSQFR